MVFWTCIAAAFCSGSSIRARGCSACSMRGISTRESSARTLDALYAGGMSRMSFVDFNELRDVGVFRDDVEYDRGMLITPDGEQIRANFNDPGATRSDCSALPRRAPARRRARRQRLFLRTEGVLRRACALCRKSSAGCSRCAASVSSTSYTGTNGSSRWRSVATPASSIRR